MDHDGYDVYDGPDVYDVYDGYDGFLWASMGFYDSDNAPHSDS